MKFAGLLQLLAALVSAEEVQRVEDLTLQRALDKMSDLIYCPRCQAPALEDNDHCTQCPKCALMPTVYAAFPAAAACLRVTCSS
jgi:hypothetical protein